MAFKGKVIVITGASSGIGAGLAEHFAKLGAHLVLCGRNAENLNTVALQCKTENNKPILVIGDIRSEEVAKNLINSTIDHYDRIDILVNNAGILKFDSIETTSMELFDQVMNTNVRSIFYLTSLAVPHLIKSEGNIVNISSVNGVRSFSGVLSYNMSKAALDQFTRCTALELAPKKVRVNSVNPGMFKTNIYNRAGLEDEAYERFLEYCKIFHPLGRGGEIEEINAAVTFLAGETANFITGVTLLVDGGRHIT